MDATEASKGHSSAEANFSRSASPGPAALSFQLQVSRDSGFDPRGPGLWLFCILSLGRGLPLYSDLGHPVLTADGKGGPRTSRRMNTSNGIRSSQSRVTPAPILSFLASHRRKVPPKAGKHTASKRPHVVMGQGSQSPCMSRAN